MKEIDVKALFEMAMDEVVALEEGLYAFSQTAAGQLRSLRFF